MVKFCKKCQREINFNSMMKKFITVIISFSAFKFFNLSIIDDTILNFFEIISFLFILYFILKNNVFNEKDLLFKIPILIILLGVILSCISSFLFKNQELFISLVASRFMYYYLVYFFLISIKLEFNETIKIINFLSIIFCIIYLIAIYYPSFVNIRIVFDETRATTRVYLSGIFVVLFSGIFNFFRFSESKKIFSLFLFLFFTIVIFFYGARAIIFPYLFIIVIIFLTAKSNIFMRSLIFAILLVLIIYYLYPILSGLIETIDKDMYSYSNSGNLYIRIKALEYFLDYLFPDSIVYLLGAGFASTKSAYGVEMNRLKVLYGFHQSDIGIIGDYTRFGILYLIGVIYIFVIVLKTKLQRDFIVLKIIFITFFIASLTITPFGYSDGIITIVFLMYLYTIVPKNNNK